MNATSCLSLPINQYARPFSFLIAILFLSIVVSDAWGQRDRRRPRPRITRIPQKTDHGPNEPLRRPQADPSSNHVIGGDPGGFDGAIDGGQPRGDGPDGGIGLGPGPTLPDPTDQAKSDSDDGDDLILVGRSRKNQGSAVDRNVPRSPHQSDHMHRLSKNIGTRPEAILAGDFSSSRMLGSRNQQ